MPKASLSTSAIYHNHVITKILSLSEIMPFCFYYAKKKLIYIIITLPTGYQPFLYAKCTKINIYSLYDIASAFNAKYTLFISLCNFLVFYLIYYKVLYLNSY